MNNIIAVVDEINREIDMGDQCLSNILSRLDEDIARITERKQQITAEFAARRRALENIIGVPAAPQQQEEATAHE